MKKGFSTLFIVIILGSVSLATAIWISTSGFWSIRNSNDTKIAEQTKALANSCAEIALDEMRKNNYYVSSDSVIINSNDCDYEVFFDGGNNRTIEVVATIKTITRKLEIKTSGFNPIIISSWQEIP